MVVERPIVGNSANPSAGVSGGERGVTSVRCSASGSGRSTMLDLRTGGGPYAGLASGRALVADMGVMERRLPR